jgi:hypothetical protein
MDLKIAHDLSLFPPSRDTGFGMPATHVINRIWAIHLTGLEHMLDGWSDLSPASTTLSPLGSCELGSRLMRTASTTWNG